jgi:hypothetical protein
LSSIFGPRISPEADLLQFRQGCLTQLEEFFTHLGKRLGVEIAGKGPLDAVDGGHQEMATAHGNIGHAKVEELLGGLLVAQVIQPL